MTPAGLVTIKRRRGRIAGKSLCNRFYVLHLREHVRAEQLTPKLIAATLTRREYLTLRNTVRVLRFSGVPLDPEKEKQVKKFEAVVRAYQEQNGELGANG